MKEIHINEFGTLEEAIDFLEEILWINAPLTDQLDGEIKFINFKWRVGVTIDGRQKEFNFEDCG